MNSKKRLKASLTNLKSFVPPESGPDELLGELLRDVQLRSIHADSKTFVDQVSEQKLRRVAKIYAKEREKPDFNLEAFVERHFKEHRPHKQAEHQSSAERTAAEHIESLWPALTRSTYRTKGSLMALPYPYIVPGGRFSEQYYWDTYFTMLGLAVSGHTGLLEGMMKNYTYLIRKTGFIPLANRTYYLSRSQPPFFSLMVDLLATKRGRRVYAQYLPYLLSEYRYWMRGKSGLTENSPAARHVARMPGGEVLNRHYDAKSTPRPEGYREDVATAAQIPDRAPEEVYRDLRAGAESGWDFSSRWFHDPMDINTIHTTDIVPVDLNCLMYELELTISAGYSVLRQGLLARRYRRRAQKRAETIQRYCWSEANNFYFDYDFKTGKQTASWHMGAVYPLYVGLATQAQAEKVANILQHNFLKPGGFVTTLEDTGQQWDSPNGWAPLQWIAFKGLQRYGFDELANEAKKRWLDLNIQMYRDHGSFFEKYNVVDIGAGAGGGEYPRQEGFGWTNGVFLAMEADKD